MKKIFVIVIFLSIYVMSSYGFFSDNPVIRNSILQIGDTTEVYDVFGAKSVMITVVDSSNSHEQKFQ